jgi:hypothetical protein
LSDHTTIDGGNNTDNISWQSKAPGNKILISWRDVSPNIFRFRHENPEEEILK